MQKKNELEFQTSPRVANVSLRSLRLAETAEIKLVKGEKVKGRWNGRRKVILPFPFRVFLLPPSLPNNPCSGSLNKGPNGRPGYHIRMFIQHIPISVSAPTRLI